MKIVIILSLMYPGESYFDEIKRIELTTMQECYDVRRELSRSYKAPAGFQYVTQCVDEDAATSGAYAGWLLQNYDKDPTRIKKTK